MEQLASILRSILDNPQDQHIVFVAMVAGTIFLMALGISFVFLGATDPIRRRLGDYIDEDAPENQRRRLVRIDTLIGPVSQWVVPQSEAERNSTVEKLTHAGFRSPNALQTYYGVKFILAVSLPILVVLATSLMPDLTMMTIALAVFSAASAGVIVPSMILDHMLERRMRALRNGFPDALDLLVVCVESGLGLSAAIQRVADELGVSHPELANELSLVNAEVRAGVDRSRALKNLATRTGLEEIKGLVSLLVQTMRFGTSVADTLRVYSEEFRDRRMQKAEEQAAKIGTKLIFPLVLCLFPSFFTVAIGPAVLRLIAVFQFMGDKS